MNERKRSTLDVGLLVLRIGIGAMFIIHGWPKLVAGPERWESLGGAMGLLGIHFAPKAWGLAAALAEFVGGILLIPGLLTRVAAAAMLFTMAVATYMLVKTSGQFSRYAWPLELAVVFLSLLIMGAGRVSLDHLLWRGLRGGAKEPPAPPPVQDKP